MLPSKFEITWLRCITFKEQSNMTTNAFLLYTIAKGYTRVRRANEIPRLGIK